MTTTPRWTDQDLDAARKVGDRMLDDDFMPQLFGQKPVPSAPCPKCARPFEQALSGAQASYDFQRLGINRLMDLTTRLLIAPELAFTDTSELKRLLDQLPLDYVNYYDPIELPKWVDTDKLAVASKLWQANSIFMLAALAAASLPYCYMIDKAIPTLYDTKKLSESRYMYQRIFETGIFVNDVMSEGGLRVFKDFVPDGDQVWLIALNEADPEGRWEVRGGQLVRTAGPGGALNQQAVQARAEEMLKARRRQRRRYVWGAGFVSARKVRFLHATMRYMLMHPGAVRPPRPAEPGQKFASPREAHQHATAPFDVAKNGVPINQEDLAYTIMTFSLVLYRSLEYFGRTVSDAEKIASLHQWKLIGYIMGVEERFLTDDMQVAEDLFRTVQERHAGHSEVGCLLTDSILDWLGSMLPPILGMRTHLPTLLCEGLLGPKLSPYVLRQDRSHPPLGKGKLEMWFWRPVYWLGLRAVRLSFWVNDNVLIKFASFRHLAENLLHRASVELIHSFRDGWARKTFWLPSSDNSWTRRRGATAEFETQLHQWRCKLANTVYLGLGSLIAAQIAMIVFAWFVVEDWGSHLLRPAGEWLTRPVGTSFAVMAGAFALFLFLLIEQVPKVVKQRPKLPRQSAPAAPDGNSK